MNGAADLAELQRSLRQHYGSPDGTHLVRAPGRVNLIGEHIDYAGLSVFPIALERHVAVCYRRRTDATIRIANTDPQFTPRTFTVSPTIDPYPAGDWGNYVKAAGQGLAQHYGSLNGFDAVVSSNIPVAAGLSSSAALVIASALAIAETNSLSIETLRLAELMAEAERYVGTRGGGMDQAICLGAKHDSASRIDFSPLRLTAVPVPRTWRFVVAFSLVRARKSGAARDAYNRRTRECRAALEAVTRSLEMAEGIDSYPALMTRVPVTDLLTAADTVLEGVLRRRFRHVVTEATRVDRAQVAMEEDDIEGFGRLMSQSHQSLRDDFEVSCPELDTLTEIAGAAGATGARLTGAGFGGCVVALCRPAQSDLVLEALAHRFYTARRFEGTLEHQLFVARPSEGASVTAV